MKRIAARRSFVTLATALFLVISFNTASTDHAVIASNEIPDQADLPLLEELVEWVSGEPIDGETFRVVGAGELITAAESQAESFELFRSFHDREDRAPVLARLPYGAEIKRVARRYQVDGLLLAALIEAESSFDPQVISPVGAIGLMQIMPATGAELTSEGDLTDPTINLEAGARYLARLLRQFDGNLSLALAAYNAGPGAVARFGGVPPYQETQRYVRRVLERYIDHHREVWESAGTADDLLALR